MENESTNQSAPRGLSADEIVVSEVRLLEAINIPYTLLSTLRREHSFPYVRFTKVNRAYLVTDVVKWLEAHAEK
jgi:hypothetical protein